MIWLYSVGFLFEKYFGVFSNVSDVGIVLNDDFFYDEFYFQIFFGIIYKYDCINLFDLFFFVLLYYQIMLNNV